MKMSKTKALPAVPNKCLSCGKTLTGLQTKYCSRRCLSKVMRRTIYQHICQCGCGISFTSTEKVQRYLSRQHWGRVLSKQQRGKNNPFYIHGLTIMDPKTGKRDPLKTRKLRQIYSTYPVVCQNPNCRKVFKVIKARKNSRKYCSRRCHGIVNEPRLKRDSRGFFTT